MQLYMCDLNKHIISINMKLLIINLKYFNYIL